MHVSGKCCGRAGGGGGLILWTQMEHVGALVDSVFPAVALCMNLID
jgi:hypothetical protein